jgi:hypothetical protein
MRLSGNCIISLWKSCTALAPSSKTHRKVCGAICCMVVMEWRVIFYLSPCLIKWFNGNGGLTLPTSIPIVFQFSFMKQCPSCYQAQRTTLYGGMIFFAAQPEALRISLRQAVKARRHSQKYGFQPSSCCALEESYTRSIESGKRHERRIKSRTSLGERRFKTDGTLCKRMVYSKKSVV